jgi:hypothetical protein
VPTSYSLEAAVRELLIAVGSLSLRRLWTMYKKLLIEDGCGKRDLMASAESSGR